MPYYRVAIVAVVMLGTGLVIGFLVGASGDAPELQMQHRIAETTPSHEAPQPEPWAPSRTAVPEWEPQSASDPVPAERVLDGGGSEAFKAWVRELGIEEVKGTGRIWGTVTAGGQPVSGAVVEARFDGLGVRLGDATGSGLESEASMTVARRIVQELGARRTVTDEQGRYEFTDLIDTEYQLSARADGYSFRGWRQDEGYIASRAFSGTSPDAEINIHGFEVGMLVLDVRMPDGSQPERASVDGTRWTPDNPVIGLSLGRNVFRVFAGGFQDFVSEEQTVTLEAGVRTELVVNVYAQPTIHCTVIHPLASGRGDLFQVHVQRSPPPEPPAVPTGLQAHFLTREGFFRSQGLSVGTYRVMASMGGRVLGWKDVELGREVIEVELRPRDVDRSEFIVVHVQDSDGVPHWAHVTAASDVMAHHISVLRISDGEYWVSRVQPATPREHQWHYTITARSTHYGRQQVSYPSDASHELVIRFEEPAQLSVDIPGLAKHDFVHQMTAGLYLGQEFDRMSRSVASTDLRRGTVHDTLTYNSLAPGIYTFVLTCGNLTLVSETLELRAGPNRASFSLPQLYSLVLTADGPIGESVKLLAMDGTRVDHYGQVGLSTRVGPVPPGRWMVTVGQESMFVDVYGDTTVHLELKPHDALMFWLSPQADDDVRRQFSREGLQHGDLLIAVEGEARETLPQLQRDLSHSRRRESVRMTVLREGQVVDVSVNGIRLSELQSVQHGVSVVPAPRG